MDILSSLSQFHFLRPWWLLVLLPAGFLIGSVFNRSDSLRAWKNVISPQLLKHLLIRESAEQGRWRPIYMLGVAWLAGIIALAGPSWQFQNSPFSEDQAAMFIVLKVSPEMLSMDIQPSRLQRSILKIHDLLALKSDVRTGLIAYAGSAHLVMPLTSDSGIINSSAAALEPEIMPQPGDEVSAAIVMANQRLKKAAVPGSIVLITDAVDASQLRELTAMRKRGGVEVHILAMAAGADVIPPAGSPPAPPLDMRALTAAAKALGGSLTVVSADKSDVIELSKKIERSISNAPAGDSRQWKDAGYYLLPLIAFLMLTLFRRGGAVAVE
ncbi:MAG: VWA domain-containing protein [Xanthomonadales bacterium]|nr:VWA domain-containing protein [Xanthomonadales bacterium]